MGKLKGQRRLSQGTSGRIVELLRRGELTIDEIAAATGLTRTAVRGQLATLQRDGTVEQRGARRGTSKPSGLYGVTVEAEQLLSRAYVPILSQLLQVLVDRVPRLEFDDILRDVGRGLMVGRPAPRGTLESRVDAASRFLNDLGGLTEVHEEGGHFVILGHGCPLAAATSRFPEVCNALESLLGEHIGHRVVQRCDRYQHRRCCFEVANGAASGDSAGQ